MENGQCLALNCERVSCYRGLSGRARLSGSRRPRSVFWPILETGRYVTERRIVAADHVKEQKNQVKGDGQRDQ
jgi:hypothetical protein